MPEKYKERQATTAKCPNCKMEHHAWHRNCPYRQALIKAGKEKQEAWVTSHKPTPARYQKIIHQAQQTSICTETNFPTLQASTKITNKQATSHQPAQEAAKPKAEMTYSQAASRASIPSTIQPIPTPEATQTTALSQLIPSRGRWPSAPSQPQDSQSLLQPILSKNHNPQTQTPDSIQNTQSSSSSPQETLTLTKSDLKDLLQNFALSLAGLMNIPINKEKLIQTYDNTINTTLGASLKRQQKQSERCQKMKKKKKSLRVPRATPTSTRIAGKKKALGQKAKNQTLSQETTEKVLQTHQNKLELQASHLGGLPVVPGMEIGQLDVSELLPFTAAENTFIGGDLNCHHQRLHSCTPTNRDGRHLAEVLESTPGIQISEKKQQAGVTQKNREQKPTKTYKAAEAHTKIDTGKTDDNTYGSNQGQTKLNTTQAKADNRMQNQTKELTEKQKRTKA
ncbi:hypothetical protein Pcinc_040178 [Petrolisthes cinctipes]|uniref:Uncharacterized protein n=1 Tax=Petrolisthes cinctipes TaxID=88211 RepID=A0AAE1EIU5_PETCI|nr:hypothetical protein Pcinc_040178 [Petrolisthes cinctipes]